MKIKKIIYCSNMSGYADRTLSLLEGAGVDIVGVFLMAEDYYQLNKTFFRRMLEKGLACDLQNYFKGRKYPVTVIGNINSPEVLEKIDVIAPDLIVNNGMMFIYKNDVLQRCTVLNTHSGHLPYYRGRCGASWAIYNGEHSYGITCHLMDEGIDSGSIVTQQIIEIEKGDYVYDLLLKEKELFPPLIRDAVLKLNDFTFAPQPQSKYEGSYFPVLNSEVDGIIDWGREPSERIYNKIRAFSFPYAGAFSIKNGKKYVISRARLPHTNRFVCAEPGIVFGETEDGGVKVSTVDGYIIIEKIIGEDTELTPATEWKQGSWISTNYLKELISIKTTGKTTHDLL
jgi:methionyl-tRNA formyltransferase